MKRNTGQVSKKVWFYKLGLGGMDWVNENKWEIRTLKRIMKDLKHENVRIQYSLASRTHREPECF